MNFNTFENRPTHVFIISKLYRSVGVKIRYLCMYSVGIYFHRYSRLPEATTLCAFLLFIPHWNRFRVCRSVYPTCLSLWQVEPIVIKFGENVWSINSLHVLRGRILLWCDFFPSNRGYMGYQMEGLSNRRRDDFLSGVNLLIASPNELRY